MNATILQVRDLPEDVLERLRERAARNGVSLSAYVRGILAREAAQEPVEDVLERIASRTPVEVTNDEIIAAVREGRR